MCSPLSVLLYISQRLIRLSKTSLVAFLIGKLVTHEVSLPFNSLMAGDGSLSALVKGFPANTQIIYASATLPTSGWSGGTEIPDFGPDNKVHLPQQFDFPKSELGKTSGQAQSQRRGIKKLYP